MMNRKKVEKKLISSKTFNNQFEIYMRTLNETNVNATPTIIKNKEVVRNESLL